MRNVDIVRGLRPDLSQDSGVSVESKCVYCNKKYTIYRRDEDGEPCRPYHLDQGEHYPCDNHDEEWRHIGEPLGFIIFAWLPRRRRNGKLGWLTFLEMHAHPVHGDARLNIRFVHTYTKSRVQH